MEQHTFRIELEREADGRWIASAPDLPHEPSVYGHGRIEALRNLVDLIEEIWQP